MSDIAKQLALIALEIEAVKFDVSKPFCWASGYYMPIYNDNRRLLSQASYRKLVAQGFSEFLTSFGKLDAIAGTATAGIPHATTLADSADLPLVYVRSKPKGHGLENQIEGILEQNAKVVVVEDVVSTGGSSVRAVEALREAGANVAACFAIFSYGFDKANKLFEEANCPLHTLVSFQDILEAAKQSNYLTEENFGKLSEWKDDPFAWGENNGFSPRT